ncbi:MAG: dTDP-4-dehydrorhamnose reductase [Deltaproteobacteria bacterium]|nr:dTDP-4-dehydrorhamnose reductase [Deltaproteobacteria bacterium]
MKILILGSKGMLGSECMEVLSKEHEIIAPDKKELDIISWDKVIETLQEVSPNIILNCAGMTDVDACETEAFKLRKINVEGPRNLAQGAARFNCKIIHISSDYVFNGQKVLPQPYFEDDTQDPLSAYGKSKVESEVGIRENAPNYIIIRTGWLYGSHGNNFVKSILAAVMKKKKKILKAVNDQFGSPTWTHRLALQIKELIKHDGMGTYHATSEGHCSPAQCAEYVYSTLKVKVKLEPITLAEYPFVAKRPVNCILENRLLKKQGVNIMPAWKKDLKTFLDKNKKALIKEARSRKR